MRTPTYFGRLRAGDIFEDLEGDLLMKVVVKFKGTEREEVPHVGEVFKEKPVNCVFLAGDKQGHMAFCPCHEFVEHITEIAITIPAFDNTDTADPAHLEKES